MFVLPFRPLDDPKTHAPYLVGICSLIFVGHFAVQYTFRRMHHHKRTIKVRRDTTTYSYIDMYLTKLDLPNLEVTFENGMEKPVLSLSAGAAVSIDNNLSIKKLDGDGGFVVTCRETKFFYDFFKKAKCAWLMESEEFTNVLTASAEGWVPVAKIPVTSPNRVIGRGPKEVFDDMNQRLKMDSHKKRVYLFYGSMGTGKSTTTQALAGMMKGCICMAVLNTKNASDAWFTKLMSSTPAQSVVVFENIEEMMLKSNISLGSILSILDGFNTKKGDVYVLTTTDIERIDEHILRPGRVDKSIRFTLATTADAKALFLLTFEHQLELSNRFAEITGDQVMPHSLLASIIDANCHDAHMAVFEMFKKREELQSLANYKKIKQI